VKNAGTRSDPLSLKGDPGVLYGESESTRFLAAVRRIKEQLRRQEKKTRQAKQKVKLALRKLREDVSS
jgi:hypothetical protein